MKNVKKSISKRIRITKHGKIMRRPMAVDHARTRKNAKRIRQKRRERGLVLSNIKVLLSSNA